MDLPAQERQGSAHERAGRTLARIWRTVDGDGEVLANHLDRLARRMPRAVATLLGEAGEEQLGQIEADVLAGLLDNPHQAVRRAAMRALRKHPSDETPTPGSR